MKSKKDWVERRQSLRTQAEGMLAGISALGPQAPPADVILHELLVHKIELEMQIEELRRAHDAMEEARDRYMELYDFAPVGYVTLNQDGMVTEINLTGASLLGRDRIKLINARFGRFVTLANQDIWNRMFINLMRKAEPEQQALVLELARTDGSTFHAYLDCQRRQGVDAAPLLRLAMFDISKIKKAEQDMREDGAGLASPLDRVTLHD